MEANHKKRTSNELFSQGQAQLSSPLKCLTSVFGMGTGVSTSLSSLDLFIRELLFSQNRITVHLSVYLRASFLDLLD